MNNLIGRCEFDCLETEGPCGQPAHHYVIWYLWPFRNMETDEEGKTIPKWVWLCDSHYTQLVKFHRNYPPTHELALDGEFYSSIVPPGISISDVTIGFTVPNPSGKSD